MSYLKKSSIDKGLAKRGAYLATRSDPDLPESVSLFYELEPAIVYKVILSPDDDLVPKLQDGESSKDYSYVGRIVCRPIYSHNRTPNENLPIALPLESNIREIPLQNEVVIVAKYLGQYYYSKKLNVFNQVNTNFEVNLEKAYGQKKVLRSEINDDITATSAGASNITNDSPNSIELGKYFKENAKIHPLIPYEGDLIIESRFGSSIRYGGYNTGNLNGFTGENPYIFIRNRENVESTNTEIGLHVDENINLDGSSIQLTSGNIVSNFVSPIETKLEAMENIPQNLSGDQIVISSNRLILSSRLEEIIGYGKKSIAWGTDGKFTINSADDIHLHSDINFMVESIQSIINSEKIYLGEGDNESEPIILGNQLVQWLRTLCDALLSETHTTAVGPSGPPINAVQYSQLRSRLNSILSKRNFGV